MLPQKTSFLLKIDFLSFVLRNPLRPADKTRSDECKAEYEDEHGDGKDDVDGHSRHALGVQTGEIIVFVLDTVTRWHLHYHHLIRQPVGDQRRK